MNNDEPLSASATPDLKGFEITDWIQGLNPVKRSCLIYARVDLLAEIDAYADQVKLARITGQSLDALREKAQRLATELEESALKITVQAWSENRITEYKKQLSQTQIMSDEEFAYHIMAAQVVEPAGFTEEHLRRIEEYSPQQASLIAQTVLKANREAVTPSVPF